MKTQVFGIDGMTCGGCTQSVRRALSALPGVSAVEVSLRPAQARVSFDPEQVDAEALKRAIDAAGYELRSIEDAV